MLSKPDQGPRGYVPRMKYPDRVPGFESKEPLDLTRYTDYISVLPGKKKNTFLRGVQQMENVVLHGVQANQESFSPSISSIVDNLLEQINGDIHKDIPVKAKREVAQQYVINKLKDNLLIEPEQEKYFSDYFEQLAKFEKRLLSLPPISLVRMVVELDLNGSITEIPEPIDFNGKEAQILRERMPVTSNKNSISPLPDLDLETKYKTDIYSPPRYIVEKIAMPGGMSEAHRAWDTKLQRMVCVKSVKNDFADANLPAFSDYTEREAKTLARLNHQGIPEVYDFIEDEGKKYMVMQYIKGDKLTYKVHDLENPLTKNNITSFVEQTASAIDYLSVFSQTEGGGDIKTTVAHPLFQLDIKPDNLIVSPDLERVVLYDFNMSSWVSKNEREDEDTTMGTMGYIPPELLRKGNDYTVQSEVYSLAATSFYLLTGHRPFECDIRKDIPQDRKDRIIALQTLEGEHMNLSDKLQLKIPLSEKNIKYLNQVINKGMDKDPNKRYKTAQEFADAFREALLLEA